MAHRHTVIVVAEDDPAIHSMLVDVLEELGYTVAGSYSGAEAVQLARRLQPDLVITDMQMETRDAGIWVLEQLRADPDMAQVGVIVCSADGKALHDNASAIARLRGAVFVKPFDLNQFIETIERLLAQPS